jgi:hypothetical protein
MTMSRRSLLCVLVSWLFVASVGRAQQPSPTLDYAFFKSKVAPIFLAKRLGMARCIACHGQGPVLRGSPQYLQPLSPGATTWNEEQTRQIFEAVSKLVVPGSVRTSKLLRKPLREEAGGEPSHAGGKHWMSLNDPEVQVLIAWVNGQRASSH